jgi:hypothetical protein
MCNSTSRFRHISAVVLGGCLILGCSQDNVTADHTAQEANATINKLNSIRPDLIELVECPNLQPNRIDNGEITARIMMCQESLTALGYRAVWNKVQRKYVLESGTKQ